MRSRRVTSAVAVTVIALALAGCGGSSSSDAAIDEAITSLEDEIPNKDRASVRVCDSMVDGTVQLNTPEDALNWTTSSLTELEASQDPNGMKNALLVALIGYGDAIAAGDPASLETAVMQLATVCTDIVSGEYGQ